MPVLVAGVPVGLGDRLYSRRANSIGTVVKVDPDVVQLRIIRGETYRDLPVVNGGYVGGDRDTFWHPPLHLDLPKGSEATLVKVQTLVDTVVPML